MFGGPCWSCLSIAFDLLYTYIFYEGVNDYDDMTTVLLLFHFLVQTRCSCNV